MSTKTLSQQALNETICAVVIILLILSVPKYIKLPDSLELLFHDTFGQILLLLFAILIGSYSFLCGVLLVILFISIMLQTKKDVSEGFIGERDADMELGSKPKSDEFFEDVATPTSTSALSVPTSTMAASTMNTPRMTAMPSSLALSSSLPSNPTSAPAIAGATLVTPMPTKMATAAKFPSDVEGYKSTIKKLEEELNECRATTLTLQAKMGGSEEETPLPTMGTNRSTKSEAFDDVSEDVEDVKELESKAKKITVMSTDEGAEEFEDTPEDGDIEEGFCGCDRSDNRVKLAKVLAQSNNSFNGKKPYENFENPPLVPQMKSANINPYDVAGCRYDNDFEKDLHDTFYGPPLASCRAYNGSNKAIGTLFYPMN